MASQPEISAPPLTQADLNLLTLDIVQKLQKSYIPGRDRIVTPENVYQPGVEAGREELETFTQRLFLPGSGVEGLEHLDDCLARLAAKQSVLFIAEHRGNLDAPSFNALLRRADSRYHDVITRLVYIAGRKLNESSEFIKMFTEKYSRLVIVPRRDYPRPKPAETLDDKTAREAFEKEAGRINRSAFRELLRLKKAGHIVVLFPLGGRLKPDADNVPVRESMSYVRAFDTAYFISMDGNTLPPLRRMEDERPVQSRIVYRVGPAVDCKAFLAEQRELFDEAMQAGAIPHDADPDQFAVENVMAMLANLRLTGRYGNPAGADTPTRAHS
jgi:1-acyl-sn-glycerol-3-phosphate acyltransferase